MFYNYLPNRYTHAQEKKGIKENERFFRLLFFNKRTAEETRL